MSPMPVIPENNQNHQAEEVEVKVRRRSWVSNLFFGATYAEKKAAGLLVVQNSGHDLSELGSLRNDKDVVLAAIAQNSKALNYASPRLKDTKEVVLAAIRKRASEYEYKPYRHSIETMKIKIDEVVRFASSSLQKDRVILQAIEDAAQAALSSRSPSGVHFDFDDLPDSESFTL
ncbi:MAG: DUF4116 domain-containing protein [Legionella sp.]|nr:DUF4116 domain-containing protein [Legionella sp.]